MQFISYTEPKLLIAEQGKKLRAINDVYEAEHVDEQGNIIEEHKPYYSDIIFVAKGVDTLNRCKELFVEERVDNE